MLGAQTEWNEYSIYQALVTAWLLREQRKAINPPLDYAEKLRLACRVIAAQMLRSSKRQFTQDEVNSVSKQWKTLLGFDRLDLGGRSLLNKDSDGHFRFSHFSIQECLAVEYLLHNQLPGDMNDIPVTDFMNKLAFTWLKSSTKKLQDTKLFAAFDFTGQSFAATDLSGTDFSDCRLAKASFLGANLSGSKFCRADLTDCREFDGTVLDYADFRNARLFGARLSGAFGRKVVFDDANLQAADLVGIS